jgi:hypothetical protein
MDMTQTARNKTYTQKVIGNYGKSEWALRARSFLFYIHKGVPMFGNALD